ncbi:amidase [Nocardiopsis valliformis]|uniref:amidase n=1 Tax=Nocardiopsis valliformis TaxID=239974 RepID=UPI00034D015C|nr:amidase [Nocardiopsis valliformis]
MKTRTITDTAVDLREGRVTATELVEEGLANADARDGELGVYITRFDDSAREAARAADERIASGAPIRPLEGIPVGIKDNMAARGGPTTANSLILDPAWGETAGDAAVVRRVKEAGGIVTGKVTTMEFAAGIPDAAKPFPVPRNAWDSDRWAGGSSSGSGSGVAAGMFLGALGTDTAGSIRMPAAYNGITGLKPTFGRVPRSGIVPLAHTLDHIGPMARSAADCALLLSVLAGADASDGFASREPVDDYPGALNGDLTGVRIGVDDLDRYALQGIDPAQPALFANALRQLEEAGATIVPVTLPMYEEASVIDLVVMASEALTYHLPDLKERWDDYSQGLRVSLGAASVLSAADYIQAQRVRRVVRERVAAVFHEVDLVITPTGHQGAPALADFSGAEPLNAMRSIHTLYWNPVGVPTLAVPIGLSTEHTPLSLTIAGRAWEDALVLRAGDALQRRTDFHLQEPGPVPAAA